VVERVADSADHAEGGETIDELDDGMVLELQLPGEGADRRQAVGRQALDRQKQLVLLGLEACLASRRFAERQKAAEEMAEMGEVLVVWFFPPGRVRGHGAEYYIVLRYKVNREAKGGAAAMSLKKAVLFGSLFWVAAITLLHAWLNLDLFRPKETTGRTFKVGFLPVTCHLTCPVNHFIQKNLNGDGGFEPIRFNGFPELKEAFISKYTDATFILGPLAMKLREDGVPIKIVYLGHRDGTALMVHRESGIFRIEDLKGKRVAVPNRYSNQRLLIHKVLSERGMKLSDVEIVEMPPPDMAAALYARAVDGITSGEPFMGQTELDGYGRVLYLTKDVWPEFISCVLAVREDVIQADRKKVQALVDGIAKSGVWLDQTMDNRMQAAQFVSKGYYNQDPRLLEFVLSKPPDRVKYTNLSVRRPDFEEIERYAREVGILNGTVHFDDYCDPSFVPPTATIVGFTFSDIDSRRRAQEKGLIR